MPQFDMFTDQQRRHLARVYGALQAPLHDELEYTFEGYAPLDEATQAQAYALIQTQLTALQEAMHSEETALMQAEVDAWWADCAAKMAPVDASGEENADA
jgi:hypothetical protein